METRLPFTYRGPIYNRPVGRGVVLEDLEGQPQLDEVLEDNARYEVEIIILKKLPDHGGRHHLADCDNLG